MLQHRTNVLFTTEQIELLQTLSQEKNKSIGELIRHAVEKTYTVSKKRTQKKKSIKQLLKEMRAIAQKSTLAPITTDEILAWRHEGHKW